MKKFKNETGAALVLTMLIITIFLIFVTVQVTQAVNSTKQVTTMEKKIDAELVAKMGVDYFQQLIVNNQTELTSIIDNNTDNKRLLEQEINGFIHQLRYDALNNKPFEIDRNNRTFEIIDIHVVVNRDNSSVTVTFESIGKAFEANNTAKGEVKIKIESGAGE
ncbi:hypothetical protein [Virgibacillus ndiopensis]|uniref:hypothetical protein n=1 Tax=Virgibacillus ndiopensis TaxID=2004408 RepID=UPI000C07F7BC|nr:hypothetical protein [Virgibacillus ndiopensis]